MDSLVFVSANAYLASRSSDAWHSNHFRPGYVPILRSDLLRFRDALDQVLRQVRKEHTAVVYHSDAQHDPAHAQPDADAAAPSGGAAHGRHQDLKQFLPISLDQQLHTVALTGLRGKLAVEQLERLLAKLEDVTSTALKLPTSSFVECWSSVAGLDTQSLFVRCQQLAQFPQVVVYWRELVTRWNALDPHVGLQLHCDQNTAHYVADKAANAGPLDPAELEVQIHTLRQFLDELYAEDKSQPAAHDSSADYKVDVSTLSDLPGSALEQLCQDIVKFRTRVLTIEKEKRAREDYEEGKRRRLQLMKVFEQIRKSQGDDGAHGAADAGDAGDADNDDAEDDEDDEDDGDPAQDWALEKERQDRDCAAADARARALLDKLNSQLEPRLRALERQLARVADYDATLASERPLYLKELLHLSHDPSYDHRRSFKLEEKQRDDDDRARNPPATASAPLPTSTSTEPVGEPAAEPRFKLEIRPAARPNASPQPDVLHQSDDELDSILARLRDSRAVHNVVKEYLGDEDQDLIDYIFDHIREHKSKTALLDELKETFDEDAAAIVDKVWHSL